MFFLFCPAECPPDAASSYIKNIKKLMFFLFCLRLFVSLRLDSE